MKRENRLRKNNEFKEVIDKHQVIKSKELVIYHKKNDITKTRIGISVSKKLGNAVTRNKIKRQIKSYINETIKLDINIDIVIIAKEEFLKNDYNTNFEIFKKMIRDLQ